MGSAIHNRIAGIDDSRSLMDSAKVMQQPRSRRLLPLRQTLAALLLVFAGVALANITLALQHALFSGPSWQDSLASLTLAAVGVTLVWRGLTADDISGSIMGYAGGTFLWMGFFEWTWANWSVWLGIEPLMVNGQPALPASLLLVQASSFIFLPLVLLMAANRDTRCRMMRWCRRRLHLAPPAPVARQSNSAARVAATETVFVIWFIYLLNIALYDPRLLGYVSELYYSAVALIAGWGLYLAGRLVRIRNTGLVIRYAIPTAYLLSIPVDAMTMAGWFPAVWIQPLQYPIAAVATAAMFLLSVITLCRRRIPITGA
ncbi:hypothetical protein [Chromatocurvus halotolerans]|uniref:Uncharacterized protein n=1 Tax=Chromatocurvus halotolerans TaxID=1132028 RepID=A0A4R2KM37_9GAMM|nr:hypothetical protein [Chromatocurvus halotolerans]TCO75151.1 hypothetical protein EV688_110106 [Chromatocurvus halotolerans]